MIPVAAAIIAGTLLGRYLDLPVRTWLAAAFAALLAGAVCLYRGRHRPAGAAWILVAIVAAAGAAATLAFWRVPADHIVNFSGRRTILATVRGEVTSRPQLRRFEQFPWRPAESQFLLRTSAIRKASGGWIPAVGLLRVTVKEAIKDLRPGEQVELAGLLRRPWGPSNPGQYDWRAADRYRHIHVILTVPGSDAIRRLRPAPGGLAGRVWQRLRAAARRHLTGLGDEQESLLLEALALGQRGVGLQALNRAMAQAGVAHFLSISGLHLGIFLSVVYGLCRLLTLRRSRAAAVALAVLAAYLLTAEPRTPLLRGAVMAAAICIAVVTGRGLAMFNALAAAAVVLLVAEPLQLFGVGFQLSFAIVAGILLLSGPIRRGLFRRWMHRRNVLALGRDHGARHWVYFATVDWLTMLVSVSLAAYVSAAPLVAYHFGIFSPYAPLLSILLLPMMVAALLPAYLSLGLAWLMPNAAAGLGHLAARAGGAIQAVVMTMQRLPGLSLDVRALPAGLVVLCYAALGLWALAGRTRRALLPAIAASLVVVGWTAATQTSAPPPKGLRLHVLDVGHGAMTVVETPGGTFLFDAGSLTVPCAYDRVLQPFLRARKLPSPQALFVSHSNADHYNALPELLQRRPPQRVYLNEFFGTCPDDPPGARALLRQFGRRGVQVVRLHAGQTVALPGGARVEVLWPPPRSRAPELAANDRSLVLRVVLGHRAVLIPGDAGQAVQARLAAAGADRLRSDVLLLPHHGAFTPALKDFVQRTAPTVLLQSAGRRRGTERLIRAIAGRRRYMTYRHGCITVELDDSSVRVRTMRGPAAHEQARPGQHHEAPAARPHARPGRDGRRREMCLRP